MSAAIRHIGMLLAAMTRLAFAFGQEDEARTHYAQGDYAAAAERYAEWLSASEQPALPLLGMGNSFYRMGRMQEAEQYYRQAVEKAAGIHLQMAWYNLGMALIRQGKLEEGITATREALKQNPADENARYNLQKALTALRSSGSQPRSEIAPQERRLPPPVMDREQAERILRDLQQREQQVQQRMLRQREHRRPAEKDW